MTTSLLVAHAARLSAEASESGDSHLSPYVFGGIALVILLGLLLGVVAFGGGREHT